jgi:beta-N-acetylhexosaminidase
MAADLARCLVVGLAGPEPTGPEMAWLAHYRPAGVILFARNCRDFAQLQGLCRRLHELVPGLEIMADHEGGPVSQLAKAVGRPPAAYGLGQLDDEALTARVHAETGRRLRAAGVTRVLAPVADVLVASRNPVIGARSFGAEADLVARQTAAAVQGLREAGLDVCLKHWPGHGGGLVDTHLAGAEAGHGDLPTPFLAGLAAGADAVMVGHLGRGADSPLPATLDPAFLAASGRQLRVGDGRRARLLADDVTMGGLRAAMAALGIAAGDGLTTGMVDPADLPLAWLKALADAGCDQLLVRGLPLAALPLPAAPTPAVRARLAGPAMQAIPTFAGEVYAEARHRVWSRQPGDFGAPDLALLWRDETIGDRWQVAGGDQGPARSQLAPVLSPQFASLADWSTAAACAGGFRRLLVTSHRPLPDTGRRDVRLAAEGVCLVMGHPSLTDSLRAYLGPGWQIGAVYDVWPGDLFVES